MNRFTLIMMSALRRSDQENRKVRFKLFSCSFELPSTLVSLPSALTLLPSTNSVSISTNVFTLFIALSNNS
ncbi:hypothetical protein Tco_0005400 [Tanacetum coccineum]